MRIYEIVSVFASLLWNSVGAENDCKPKDCYDLKCYRVSRGEDGSHTIYPDTENVTQWQLDVSCDQITDGGGWIIYQRRLDGSVNFERNWDDYKNGFGIIGGDTEEMWLGNENVYQLLQGNASSKASSNARSNGSTGTEFELRFEVHSFDGDSGWVSCYPIQMSPEYDNYSLTWDTIEESLPGLNRDLEYHKNKPFTTIDRVNSMPYCISNFRGGWWFGRCVKLFLNGVYISENQMAYTSIHFDNFKGFDTLQKSVMMLRPTNSTSPCHNPCKNDGACAHVAATKSYRCMCNSEFCGTHYEIPKPCEVGTCVYDAAAKTNTWKCEGLPWLAIAVVVVIILLLITALAAGVGLFLYRQKLRKEAEVAAAKRSSRLAARLKADQENVGFFSYFDWIG